MYDDFHLAQMLRADIEETQEKLGSAILKEQESRAQLQEMTRDLDFLLDEVRDMQEEADALSERAIARGVHIPRASLASPHPPTYPPTPVH